MRVLVLHSAYGLRPAVHDAVQRLQAAGHTAHAPDLYDGATADTMERALALRDALGSQELLARALAAVEAWAPEALVGFSLGASLAQRVALRRGAPRHLLFFHGIAEPVDRPVPGLRVQTHIAEGDPFEADDDIAAWRDSFERAGATVAVHRYPGGGHVFTDPGLPDFHAASAEHAWTAALRWLAPAPGSI